MTTKLLPPPLVNRVHCMDALELMRLIPAQSVDAIITDLPYGTTACSWDEIIPFAPMWAGVKRVLKPRGVFVTTASQPFTSKLIMSNLDWYRHSWVWVKNVGSNFLNANREPMKEHEDVLVFADGVPNYSEQRIERLDKQRAKYAYKADNTKRDGYGSFDFSRQFASDINTRCASSVLKYNRETGYHFNQKPVALYEYLIRTYTQPGELVLDFCAGSGTTLVAARNLKRHYIGGDTSAEYCEVARERLKTDFASRKLGGETPLNDLPMFRGDKLYQPAGMKGHTP